MKSLLPVPSTSLERYLIEITNYPVQSRKEEYELAMKYRETGDLEAARKLITSNLRFVIKIANEYRNYDLNPMDIIQEGNIGLMQAVKRFDPTKGYRLITYAVWWIRAYVQNYIIRTWSLVKVGTTQSQRKLFYKLRSTKQKMNLIDERLSPEDYKSLAKELGVKEQAAVSMDKRMATRDLSLDAQIDNETSHMDFLVDEAADQEQVLSKAQESEALKSGLEVALEELKDREKYILENRVLSQKPKTLEELGSELNISRERVRQIESAALKKVRSVLKKRGVSE
ncbi:MAG: RNA polymerase sigma factor RpoH [Candidatus Dadabacteria bacterium]|nr:RNA polymerase sigma factor RpoH [Candidatus Dadabacteria bacterium]